MSSESGNRNRFEMRPDDHSGRYWSAPPCRVRVDDGDQVTWVDLKRPYALIGSHPCCTLRIRGSHIPDIAYFACCLRDRVEVWPTAAIAFPRWGAVPSDLPVVVGPFSLTFHPAESLGTRHGHVPVGANSEIETRLSWPGQTIPKVFHRPVTIIGDTHPSILRLHGRGLADCHFAAVVQDQSFWLVDLTARRMRRNERVRRFQKPGDKFEMGDATLEFLAARPVAPGEPIQDADRVDSSVEDSEVDDIHDDDIHDDEFHDDHGQSGISLISRGAQRPDPDPSGSFIGSIGRDLRPSRDAPDDRHPDEHDPDTHPRSRRNVPPTKRQRGEEDVADDASLLRSDPHLRRDRSVDDDLYQPPGLEDMADSDSGEVSALVRRVDAGRSTIRRPLHDRSEDDQAAELDGKSSSAAVLSLVDAAMGLVDQAVQESDASAVSPESTRTEDIEVLASGQRDARGLVDDSPLFIDSESRIQTPDSFQDDGPNEAALNGTSGGEVSISKASKAGHVEGEATDHGLDDTNTVDPSRIDPEQSVEETPLEFASTRPDADPERTGDRRPDEREDTRDWSLNEPSQAKATPPETFSPTLPAVHVEPATSIPFNDRIEPAPQPEMSRRPSNARSDDIIRQADSTHATLDPEALTSHVTSRLAEIGQGQSVLQQIVRWSAITTGIIVPATVVAWVVYRIYSDWY